MDSRTARVLIIATTVLAIAGWGLSYALHVETPPKGEKGAKKTGDKKRRKKKVAPATTKAATPTAAAASTSARPAVPSQIPELPIKLDAEQVKSDLIKIRTLPKPETADEVEPFVLKCTSIGDILAEGGPSTYYFAALEYYRGVVAYHDQEEIMQIFGRTAPPEVYSLLTQIIAISKTLGPYSSNPTVTPPGGAAEGWHLVEEGSETGEVAPPPRNEPEAPEIEPMD